VTPRHDPRAVVFLGPSRPPGLLADPRVVVRPPARRGDLAAAAEEFAVVGLVDGELYQSLAVTPAEVRAALRRVPVYGAASLGALRAVEVPGVLGIGEVYAAFRDGRLTDDDELVGTWNPDDGRPIAWPLVLAREALRGATVEQAALERMKALPFHERTRAALRACVRAAGGDEDVFAAALVREPNVKQRDAAALVRAVVAHLAGRAAER
jgi:ribosomal protein S12 methylthiotransferase accessory factor